MKNYMKVIRIWGFKSSGYLIILLCMVFFLLIRLEVRDFFKEGESIGSGRKVLGFLNFCFILSIEIFVYIVYFIDDFSF